MDVFQCLGPVETRAGDQSDPDPAGRLLRSDRGLPDERNDPEHGRLSAVQDEPRVPAGHYLVICEFLYFVINCIPIQPR